MVTITHTKISAVSDGGDTSLVRPSDWNDAHVIPKIASDNLRNSHDAEITTSSGSYVKLKTITVNQKLYGTVRIKFDLKDEGAPFGVHGRIYHQGVALGTDQSTFSMSYITISEDITHNFEVADTIELWAYGISGDIAYVRNFRLYYDNADITTVSTTNS